MSKIQLSIADIAACEKAARDRDTDSVGYQNSRDYEPGADDFAKQVASFAGEVAAARFLKIAPQTGVAGMGKPDIVTDGFKIDVKSSLSPRADLSVSPGHLHQGWHYCLARVDLESRTVEIVGFASAEEVRFLARLTNFGNTRRAIYLLPAGLLSRNPEEGCPI